MAYICVFGILSLLLRFFPHIPNFSPFLGLAVASGFISRNKYNFFLVTGLLVISDLLLGISRVNIFIWVIVGLISLLSSRIKASFLSLGLYSLGSSLFYFLSTNFWVWLEGWYPQNAWGLYTCYLRAIPFFRTQIVSTLVFAYFFYTGYLLVSHRARLLRFKSSF